MKKIFINPEVRVFNVECDIICVSDPTQNGHFTDPSNNGGDNYYEGNGTLAPVRMDIFNYGGLQ